MQFTIEHISELESVVKAVTELMRKNRVFLLKGEMGTGKTTFMKALGQALNLKDIVSSPTYSLVNEYVIDDQKSIYHFDLYRLHEFEELLELGFDDYLFSGHFCFIEWPEIANSLLPEDSVQISISIEKETRIFSLDQGKQ